MNLFTVVTLTIMSICGYFGSKFLASFYGLAGGIIGFAAGFFLAFLFQKFILNILCKLFPSWPPCKVCKVNSGDYEFIKMDQIDNSVELQCKCGARYIHKTPYFNEKRSDGSVIPYMKKQSFGRWKPTEE